MNEQNKVYSSTHRISTRVKMNSWKKTVGITLPQELIERARNQGLNISKVTENALLSILDYLQVPNANRVIDETSSQEVSVDRAGFEPAASALRSRNQGFCTSFAVDWKGFEDWLRREHRSKTASDMLRYVKKYYRCLLNRNLSELLALSKDTCSHTLCSLSALSKFLGVHEDFLRLVKNYGLKWNVRNDDLLIARFTRAQDHGSSVFDWVKLVKVKCPELIDFMDFMTVTGLRFDEAVESYNLIIKLSQEDKLKEYFNAETETLEHFRFKEVFIRRTKKAFISFMHQELVHKISKNTPLNIYSVQTRVKRRCKKLAFGDIREAHATLSIRHLRESEIDFLHGRVSTSVFMRNYFNPALISDLKDRVFKTIDELIHLG